MLSPGLNFVATWYIFPYSKVIVESYNCAFLNLAPFFLVMLQPRLLLAGTTGTLWALKFEDLLPNHDGHTTTERERMNTNNIAS